MNKLVQKTFAALLHEIKTSIGQSPTKAVRSVEFYGTCPIVNAARTQLNQTNTVRNNDIHEMHLFTSAVWTHLSQTIRTSQGKQFVLTVQQKLIKLK